MKKKTYRVYTLDIKCPARALKTTIRLMGRGIIDGSAYPLIRSYSAQIAALAPPKNYLQQIKNIYNQFLADWRYVQDPIENETMALTGYAMWGQTLGKHFGDNQPGYGDCDDAAICLGAMLRSVGFPVRIVTIASPWANNSQLYTHVYIQVNVPGIGYINADPVGYPDHRLGWQPPQKRWAIWGVYGDLLEFGGLYTNKLKNMLKLMHDRKHK